MLSTYRHKGKILLQFGCPCDPPVSFWFQLHKLYQISHGLFYHFTVWWQLGLIISSGDPYPTPFTTYQQSTPYPLPGDESSNLPEDEYSEKSDTTVFEDAKAFASVKNISIDEATVRLKLQDVVGNLNAQLARNERDTFAGLWIQHEPDYRVIIQFTNNGDAIINSYIQNTPLMNLVEVRLADVSLNELKSEQLRVTQIMNQSNIPFRTGINVVDNKVNTYVLNPEEVSIYLQLMGEILPAHTQIIKVNEIGVETADIYGGLALSFCTSGFSVIDDDGTAGITTAGHCPNEIYYDGVLLPFKAGTTGGDYDIQWHRGDHEWQYVKSCVNSPVGWYPEQAPKFF